MSSLFHLSFVVEVDELRAGADGSLDEAFESDADAAVGHVDGESLAPVSIQRAAVRPRLQIAVLKSHHLMYLIMPLELQHFSKKEISQI